MNDNRRFAKGSGVYQCMGCGRSTRETGGGEADLGLCRQCLEQDYALNALNDGEITKDEYDERLVEIEEKWGGD